MSKKNNPDGSKIGFCGWLTLLFIALKLCKVITWSWWWVLSPFWIPLVIIIVLEVIIKLLD